MSSPPTTRRFSPSCVRWPQRALGASGRARRDQPACDGGVKASDGAVEFIAFWLAGGGFTARRIHATLWEELCRLRRCRSSPSQRRRCRRTTRSTARRATCYRASLRPTLRRSAAATRVRSKQGSASCRRITAQIRLDAQTRGLPSTRRSPSASTNRGSRRTAIFRATPASITGTRCATWAAAPSTSTAASADLEAARPARVQCEHAVWARLACCRAALQRRFPLRHRGRGLVQGAAGLVQHRHQLPGALPRRLSRGVGNANQQCDGRHHRAGRLLPELHEVRIADQRGPRGDDGPLLARRDEFRSRALRRRRRTRRRSRSTATTTTF